MRTKRRISRAVLACTATLGLMIFHSFDARQASAVVPPSLQDSGDCGLDASQPESVDRKKSTLHGVSFFEPARHAAVGGITDDDLKALSAAVDALKKNKCYEVCVRERSTANTMLQATERECDLVYVVAHGSSNAPYVSFGGTDRPNANCAANQVNASSVWIAACQGASIAQALNKAGNTGVYRTLPGFDANGNTLRNAMIQGLTAELARLKDTECEDPPKRVCILAGVQEVYAVAK